MEWIPRFGSGPSGPSGASVPACSTPGTTSHGPAQRAQAGEVVARKPRETRWVGTSRSRLPGAHAIPLTALRPCRSTARGRSVGDLCSTHSGRPHVERGAGPRGGIPPGVRLPGVRRRLRHDYPLTPGIGRALRSLRPDVLVVSGWSTFASQAAIAWSRAHGIHSTCCSSKVTIWDRAHAGARREGRRRTEARSRRRGRPRCRNGGSRVGSRTRAAPDQVRVFADTVDVEGWLERADRLSARGNDGNVVCSVSWAPCAGKRSRCSPPCYRASGDERLRMVVAGDGPEASRLAELAEELRRAHGDQGRSARGRACSRVRGGRLFALLSRTSPGCAS